MDDTSETVTRPKSAPECWLIASIGQLDYGATRGNETPYISFELSNPEPHPQNSEEIQKELETVDFSKMRSPFRKTLAADFWLTPDAKYRLTDMLDRVVGGRNRTIRERVAEMPNQRVQFKIRPHRDEQGNDTGQNTVISDSLTLAST
jgi:hypothetical protein